MIDAYGTVRYNGYDFPASYKSSVSSEPVLAEDTKNIKYWANTLTIEFIISTDTLFSAGNVNAAGSIDAEMNEIRYLLSQPRKDLYYTYQGAGFTIFINGDSNTDDSLLATHLDDVAGGPTPTIINWEPLGCNKAARVVWAVEFNTPYCWFAPSQAEVANNILSFEYNRKFDLNESGAVVVQTNGFIELSHRNNTTTQPGTDNADSYGRSYVNVGIPIGFRRSRQTFNVSTDGRKLEFAITDEEVESDNAMFPYTIKVEAKHRITSSRAGAGYLKGSGLVSWTNEIPVEVTIAPGYPQSLAFQIFLWIFYQRYKRIDGTGGIVDPDDANEQTNSTGTSDGEQDRSTTDKKAKPRNILVSLDFEEDIYGRTHRFKGEYLGVYKLDHLLSQSGLFQPVNTRKDSAGKYPWESGYDESRTKDWQVWGATLPVDQYGYREATDAPVRVYYDPCISQSQSDPFIQDYSTVTNRINYTQYPTNNSSSQNTGREPDPNVSDDFAYEPPADESFVNYTAYLSISEQTRNYPVGIQRYNSEIDAYKQTTQEQALDESSAGFYAYRKPASSSSQQPDTAYNVISGDSYFIIYLNGHAIRYGLQIGIPALISASGTPLKRIGQPFFTQRALTMGERPFFMARWSIPFLLPSRLLQDVDQVISSSFGAVTGGLV